MTKTYGLLSDAPRGRPYQRPKVRLTQEERDALTRIVDTLGPTKASTYLGVSSYVLSRSIAGGFIQGTSYDVIAEGFESETLKQALLEREQIASLGGGFKPGLPGQTLDATRLEKLRALYDQLGHAKCAKRVGVSELVVTRALAGAPLQPEPFGLLSLGIDAARFDEPSPSAQACPHCDGLIVEEALAIWLRDVRNRRICRELLTAAQKKSNNYY